jgi:orotidine-5'-phosphate decarboxylase
MLNGNWQTMIKIAKVNGIYGIVAPANNQDLLIKIRKDAENLKIISPGSIFQGGDPLLTLENGADYVIIGRGIYESKDPVEFVNNFNGLCKRNNLLSS